MPRKDFHNDLQDARARALPKNITSVKPGDEDGTFTLIFEAPGTSKARFQVQISDITDYPQAHSFFVYTDSEDVAEQLSSALERLSILSETTIEQTIEQIARGLNSVTDLVDLDSSVEIVGEDDWNELEEDFEDQDDLDDGFSALEDDSMDDKDSDSSPNHKKRRSLYSIHQFSDKDLLELRDRICKDLQQVKEAGFRVAHSGDIYEPGERCYLMISVRIAKLGIPEDALQAWNLRPSEYIMLLIRYHHGYQPLSAINGHLSAKRELSMHILVTQRYKLTDSEIIEAIATAKKNDKEKTKEEDITAESNVHSLFIGSALDELLNTRLAELIKYRLQYGLNWAGAMSYYNDYQGAHAPSNIDLSLYLKPMDEGHTEGLAEIVLADCISENTCDSAAGLSFPLIAAQFAIRHTARCTEFCLVCYDRTTDDFEALKPYVCSKPLCLYQYMSMGLGPGIEFEILSQPYVADLLISFCFNSAATYGLKNTPSGIGLRVPNPNLLPRSSSTPRMHLQAYKTTHAASKTQQTSSSVATGLATPTIIAGTWSEDLQELKIVENQKIALERYTIRTGDWITFWAVNEVVYHCKVVEIFPKVYRYQRLISRKIEKPKSDEAKQATKYGNAANQPEKKTQRSQEEEATIFEDISIIIHDTDYDELDSLEKQSMLCTMLNTLPSVNEMANYLKTAPKSKALLSRWSDRIIPSALVMFRWIIVSNRSCLLYTSNAPNEEMIKGMPGYLQFRFASGAPDKESRFLKEVRSTATRRGNSKQPTIFAWHGSPVRNWHSIIREGLNFDRVDNGRAYGHGVYHAIDANTSTTYSINKYAVDGLTQWASSILVVDRVLSLNELVNAPDEFRSHRPYMVVQKPDWIQTRYLFVKCRKLSDSEVKQEIPTSILLQDPNNTALGTDRQPIIIPSCAIRKSRRDMLNSGDTNQSSGNDKRKSVTFMDLTYDDSEESDCEDIGLYSDQTAPTDTTKFCPGSLDRSRLPMLAEPSYATPSSSKALQREIKAMLKEQTDTPLRELGWYLDPEHIDNPYQWIVELHSFDKDLPLAKDMESQNVTSIVLEIRFGPSFNFSPPFVRVIKPRFLPFLRGGGGHVTAGGALCMQLLTSDGWNPSSTMSAVLLQVRMAITSTEPRPARLEMDGSRREYGIHEAIDAYTRACQTHGWKIPDDFRQLSTVPNASASALMGGGSSAGPASVPPNKKARR